MVVRLRLRVVIAQMLVVAMVVRRVARTVVLVWLATLAVWMGRDR